MRDFGELLFRITPPIPDMRRMQPCFDQRQISVRVERSQPDIQAFGVRIHIEGQFSRQLQPTFDVTPFVCALPSACRYDCTE